MAGTLGNIGSFFSSGTGKGLESLAGLGATGAGLYGNISADQQRAAAAKQAQANMNLTPAQLSAQVNAATQPLNAGLVQAVTGQTNANLAEQGLSEAPGHIAQATAQGLAPYEQQNQQNALQLVMQKLGLPAQLLQSIGPNANLSQLLALLMRQNNPTPGSGAGPYTTGPDLSQLSPPPDSGTYGDSPFDISGLGGTSS